MDIQVSSRLTWQKGSVGKESALSLWNFNGSDDLDLKISQGSQTETSFAA